MASDPPPGSGPNTRISNWPGSVRRYLLGAGREALRDNSWCGAQATARSFRLDVGRADDLAPGLHLRLDAGGKILGRTGDNLEAERRQTFLHVRQGENVCDFVA